MKSIETWTANGFTFTEGDFDTSSAVGFVAWKLSLAASVRLPDKASTLDFYRRMAEQLVARAGQARDPGKRETRIDCRDWLRDVLAAGPVGCMEVLAMGADAGFLPRHLKRAKTQIGARSTRDGFGSRSKWYWTI